jgi:glutamate carboxypeptidase
MPVRRCSSTPGALPPSSVSICRCSTGGGSDGNFTAPLTATLDGLGVDGEGAHTHYEQLYISSIEPRARLLHRLYQTLR